MPHVNEFDEKLKYDQGAACWRSWRDEAEHLVLYKLAANPRVARDNHFYGSFIFFSFHNLN